MIPQLVLCRHQILDVRPRLKYGCAAGSRQAVLAYVECVFIPRPSCVYCLEHIAPPACLLGYNLPGTQQCALDVLQ